MRPKFVFRIRILSIFVALVAALFITRLYFLQIVQGPAYRQAALAQYVEPYPDVENRGNIYFTTKDGLLVTAATTEAGFRIAIDPQTLSNPDQAYAKINAIIPVDKTRFMNAAANKKATYAEVAFMVDDTDGAKVRVLDIPGVFLVQDQWRTYPAGDLAAETVGFMGYSGTSTSKIGVYGLEKSWNSTLDLSGSGLYVNPFAQIFDNLGPILSGNPAAQQGSIVTSIEPNVQQELQTILQGVMQQYTPYFDGGIIMDPHTGAIYAMAQEPTFDPNTYNTVTDPSVFTNILVSGRYEMGSIMKPLTMAAGIDSGAITASTTYDDTGCIKVSGAQICNFDLRARGVIPVPVVLDESLNVGASWIATKTGYPTFTKYMKSYDLGEPTGIDLPDEVSGDLSNLGDGNGPAVNYDTASFGQGITVSPIEMIRALSALANNGQLVNPHVVTAVKYESGVTESIPVTQGPQVMRPSSAQSVSQMLQIVYDDYELHGAIKMTHYTAASKTGTAQIPNPATGTYYPGDIYIHSFFGYFPATNPRFIIFLYAYRPVGQLYAADTLAEPFYQLAQFLINYYNIPPDR